MKSTVITGLDDSAAATFRWTCMFYSGLLNGGCTIAFMLQAGDPFLEVANGSVV